jgi:hypothetical protein
MAIACTGMRSVHIGQTCSAGIPAWRDLASHKNITRPLRTLSGPTIQSIPDSKMVTECAKWPPGALECARTRTRDVCPFCGSYSGRVEPPESNSVSAGGTVLPGSSRAFGPWLVPEPG